MLKLKEPITWKENYYEPAHAGYVGDEPIVFIGQWWYHSNGLVEGDVSHQVGWHIRAGRCHFYGDHNAHSLRLEECPTLDEAKLRAEQLLLEWISSIAAPSNSLPVSKVIELIDEIRREVSDSYKPEKTDRVWHRATMMLSRSIYTIANRYVLYEGD